MKKYFVGTEEEAERLRTSPFLRDGVERARAALLERLTVRPEWTTARWTPVRAILRAFAAGVLQSDQWYVGYRVPFGFEEVANHLAAALEATYGQVDLVEVSLLDVRTIIGAALKECVTWRRWGAPEHDIAVVSPETPQLAPARVPLDLEAIVYNACAHLRDDRRIRDIEQARRDASE